MPRTGTRKVPLDERFRRRADTLTSRRSRLVADGRDDVVHPVEYAFCELAALCEDAGVWLHVDAAMRVGLGGPELRWSQAGVDRGDSWSSTRTSGLVTPRTARSSEEEAEASRAAFISSPSICARATESREPLGLRA